MDKKEQTEILRNNIRTENVANYGTAVLAHANAKRGKRSYKQVREFEENKDENLRQIVSEIQNGTYRTTGYTIATISDGAKERIIAKVPYRDRVAQWMIAIWYEPYFQNIILDSTHAAIRGRGIHSALQQAEKYIKKDKYEYCLKLDIRKYFPHVDREILIEMLRDDFKDDNLYGIVANIIRDAPDSVADSLGHTIHNGIPIGNYSSQYLANRYMISTNQWMDDAGIVYVQYMDDIVIFAHDKDTLRKIFREVEWLFARNLNLTIKSNWQIFPVSRGVDFVGYRIFPNKTMLRRSNFLNMRRNMAKILKRLRNGGMVTDSMRSSVMSYLGIVSHCTKGVRSYIFETIFEPLTAFSGLELTGKLEKIYESNK